VVASPSLMSQAVRAPGRRRSGGRRSLQVIQGSLSARKVERQSPWLAGLHRVSSGALVGLGVSMLGLSGLTLHWQSEWARSFAEMEASKTLEHRMQEASALLEQHHLAAVRRPGQLVPTSSEKLIHLSQSHSRVQPSPMALLANFRSDLMPGGY